VQFMTISDTVTDAVLDTVARVIGVDTDEVTYDATLLGDLGAESIDLLDILFRIERSTGVKIAASDLGDYIQGGIPDDRFSDDAGMITAEGMEHLKTVMPQLDDSQVGKLEAEHVISHFTVQNLGDMVAQRAAAGAGA
jgi:acyl carrier protein